MIYNKDNCVVKKTPRHLVISDIKLQDGIFVPREKIMEALQMSDDFLIHTECGTEVESVFVYKFVEKVYEPLDEEAHCSTCGKVVSVKECFWKHIDYDRKKNSGD